VTDAGSGYSARRCSLNHLYFAAGLIEE